MKTQPDRFIRREGIGQLVWLAENLTKPLFHHQAEQLYVKERIQLYFNEPGLAWHDYKRSDVATQDWSLV